MAELGEWHKSRREWPEALKAFQSASDATAFSPDEVKNVQQRRAWRGVGFVLIEQGKLDEAEKMFRNCLKLDPNDAGAQRELDYIESQRKLVRNK